MKTMCVGRPRIRLPENQWKPEWSDPFYAHYENQTNYLGFLVWKHELKDPKTYQSLGELQCTRGKNYKPDMVCTQVVDGRSQIRVFEYYGRTIAHKFKLRQPIFVAAGHAFHECRKHPRDGKSEHFWRSDKTGKRMTWQEIIDADQERLNAIEAEFETKPIIIYECEFLDTYVRANAPLRHEYDAYLKVFPDRRPLDQTPRSSSEILRMASFICQMALCFFFQLFF